MKIGILTHPLETNYGGILQAFALQKVLKNAGHDVYIIDRHRHIKYSSFAKHLVSFVTRYLVWFFTGKVSPFWNPEIPDSVRAILIRNLTPFIARNLKLTRKVFSEDLAVIDDEYKFDAYIVGSDQIWLPNYCPECFLDFVNREHVIRITYAASCGNVSFADNPTLLAICQRLVQKFKAISVREDYLVDFSKVKLGVNALHVLDPTFLLEPKDYLSTTSDNVPKSPIVFTYILDPSEKKKNIIDKVSNFFNIESLEVNAEKKFVYKPKTCIENCILPAIDDWIHNLKRAEFVVTDSFHGTVFAILFNKQFITIGNKTRGIGRFNSLLRTFNLQSRLITENDLIEDILSNKIDYSRVNTNLLSLRNKSISFLLDNLK